MNIKREDNDFLDTLFDRLPDEELPVSFRHAMMQKVFAEAARIKKRNERLILATIIFASLVMVGVAIVTFIYLDMEKASFIFPQVALSPFYLYIGVLTMILLTIDHLFRSLYKKHKDTKEYKKEL
ncbi:MAG: hypothetical protein LIO97_11220 [Tannerellaceae bacterium]|nr:hypothetical protein [Tannerellaceae bacterium]